MAHGGFMTLDDVYGPEHDRFPLEQERTPPVRALEWDDATESARRHAGSRDGAPRNDMIVRAPLAVLLQVARRFA
jgi:hypothetical protein